jgi:hypothetical protein
LVKFQFPTCAFTSYFSDEVFPAFRETPVTEGKLLEGSQFLRQYLSQQLKTIGNYGFFKREYIQTIGGMEPLGTGFSPYSDNLLAIKAGLLKNIVYIDAPLVFFRTHAQSTSWTNNDLDAYSSAQQDLLSQCVEMFRSEQLRHDFDTNLFFLLKWCLRDYWAVMRRGQKPHWRKWIGYVFLLQRYIRLLQTPRSRSLWNDLLHKTYKFLKFFVSRQIRNYQKRFFRVST